MTNNMLSIAKLTSAIRGTERAEDATALIDSLSKLVRERFASVDADPDNPMTQQIHSLTGTIRGTERAEDATALIDSLSKLVRERFTSISTDIDNVLT